ncbi:hypothetical protein AGMMS49525_15830 [Bacteroidia bacterium]|nr:hypothetical protein AGMMS49525_15830 [Bacteroidia bacterium]
MKQNWKPGTLIYPLPAIMVSVGNDASEYNILTVSWVGTICSDPALCYISVRPERHSYPILKKNMEFVPFSNAATCNSFFFAIICTFKLIKK